MDLIDRFRNYIMPLAINYELTPTPSSSFKSILVRILVKFTDMILSLSADYSRERASLKERRISILNREQGFANQIPLNFEASVIKVEDILPSPEITPIGTAGETKEPLLTAESKTQATDVDAPITPLSPRNFTFASTELVEVMPRISTPANSIVEIKSPSVEAKPSEENVGLELSSTIPLVSSPPMVRIVTQVEKDALIDLSPSALSEVKSTIASLTEEPVSNLSESPPSRKDIERKKSPIPKGVKKSTIMKVIGFGSLLLSGIWGSVSSVFQSHEVQKLPEFGQLEQLRTDIMQANLDVVDLNRDVIKVTDPSVRTWDLHTGDSSRYVVNSFAELAKMHRELDEGLPPAKLQHLSEKVAEVRAKTFERGKALTEIFSSSLWNSLSQLIEEPLATSLSTQAFLSVVGPSTGSQPTLTIAEEQQVSVFYQERLEIIGRSQAARDADQATSASQLATRLAQFNDFNKAMAKIFAPFTAEIHAANSQISTIAEQIASKKQIIAQLPKEERELNEPELVQELQVLEKSAASLLQTLQTSLNKAKQKANEGLHNLIITCVSREPQGFFLPISNGLMHILPDKGSVSALTLGPENKQTASSAVRYAVRLYGVEQDGQALNYLSGPHFRPYIEKANLVAQELLSKEFSEELLEANLVKFSEGTAQGTALNLLALGKGEPFGRLFRRSEIPPHLPSITNYAITQPSHLASMLANVINVEVGLEAALDLQISTLNHFIHSHAEQLGANPDLHRFATQSLASTALSSELVAKHKDIDEETLVIKTSFLEEMDVLLKHKGIQLRSALLLNAPKVLDEAKGVRLAAKGQIPAETKGLREIAPERSIEDSSQTNLLAEFIHTKAVYPVYPDTVLSPSDLQALSTRMHENTATFERDFVTFRAWTTTVLKDPAILARLTGEEARNVVDSLSLITTQVASIGRSNEVALALTETIAVVNELLPKLTFDTTAPEGLHLPLDLYVKQLNNPFLFGGATPQLEALAARSVSTDPSKVLFSDIINIPKHMGERPAIYPPSSHQTAYELYHPGINYLMIDRSNTDTIPFHLTFEAFDRVREGVDIRYVFIHEKTDSNLASISTIVRNAARHSATIMHQNVMKAVSKLDSLPANPREKVRALIALTEFLNFEAIPNTTIEMLSDDQRYDIIDAAGKIARHLTQATFLSGTTETSPTLMLAQLELLYAVADRVKGYFIESDKNSISIDSVMFLEIVENINLFFRTFDAKIDSQRLKNILKWIDLKNPYRSHRPGLFGPGRERGREIGLNKPFNPMLDWIALDTAILTTKVAGEDDKLDDIWNYHLRYLTTKPVQDRLERLLIAFADPNFSIPSYGKLPAWYYSLRDLTYLTYHSMNGGFLNPNPTSTKPDDFTLVYTTSASSFFGRVDQVQYNFKGVTTQQYAEKGIPDGSSSKHLFAHLEPALQFTGVTKQVRDIHLKKGKIQPRSVYDLNAVMAADVSKVRDKDSTDDYRIRYSLRAEKSLQFFLTLSNYEDNPHWLETPDQQIEFLNLLFDPGLLFDQFIDPSTGPQSELKLSQFLARQYKLHAGNKELRAFLIEVGLRVNQYSDLARENAPAVYREIPKPAFLIESSALPKVLLNTTLTSQERSSYAALRALEFLTYKHLDDTQALEFLNAVLHYRAAQPLSMPNEVTINRQLDEMMYRFGPDLVRVFSSENSEALSASLKTALKNIYDLTSETLIQDAENPYVFKNSAGTFSLNIKEGLSVEEGKSGVALPSSARLSVAYNLAHGSDEYRAKRLDAKSYEFTDKQDFVNIVQEKEGGWHLYRKLAGHDEPYELVTHQWMAAQTENERVKPWLDSDWMLSRYTHWHKPGKPAQVLLLDKHNEIAFRIELKGRDVKGIYKSSAKDGSEWLLADINQPEYAWIKQFESPRFSHVWLSKDTNRGVSIEFPRLGPTGTSFSWNSDMRRWQYDADPQFFIADKQVNLLFPGKSVLVLTGENGKERLLMPRANVGLLSNTFQTLLSYTKNAKTGEYEGNSLEATMYLAMLYFENGNPQDYLNAHKLLLKIQDPDRRFSAEEMDILNIMIAGHSFTNRDLPQAVAIRALAAAIKQENLKEYPAYPDEPNQIADQLLNRYIRIFKDVPALRLPLALEVELFKDSLLVDTPEVDLNSKLEEMLKIDPAATRQALDGILPKMIYGPQRINLDAVAEQPLPALAIGPRPVAFTRGEFNKFISSDEVKVSGDVPLGLQEVLREDLGMELPTKNFLREYAEGIREYQQSIVHYIYTLKDAEGLHAKRLEIEKAFDKLSMEMEVLKIKILCLANPVASTSSSSVQAIVSGTEQVVSLDALLRAYGSGNIRKYRGLNAQITEKKARQLDALLSQLIDAVPDWQYHKNLLASLDSIEKNPPDSDVLQVNIKELSAAIGATRQFPPDVPRLLRLMEYETSNYYRKDQVESLNQMGFPGLGDVTEALSSTQSAVFRIGVGKGKTSRIAPSLVMHMIEQGKLALFIMPQAQLSSAGEEFAQIMKNVYGRSSYRLNFSGTHVTKESTAEILKKLTKALKKGQPVITSGISIKALLNVQTNKITKYIETNDRESLEIANNLKAINKLLASTKPIIDEVHSEFDPNVETNNPMGSTVALDPSYAAISLNLYEILQDGDIQAKMHFNHLKNIKQPLAKPFSEELFRTEIAPLVAQKFIERLLLPHLDVELVLLANFVKAQPVAIRERLIAYLLKKIPIHEFRELDSIPADIKNQLGLLRGQLNVLLPQALNKNFGERYGFASPEDVHTSPLRDGQANPSGSQFNSPFIRMNYDIQGATVQGFRRPMVEKIVEDLRAQDLRERNILAKSELSTPDSLSIPKITTAQAKLSELFKTTVALDTPNLVDLLMKQLNDNPNLKRELLKTYVLNDIKVYSTSIKATSQHYAQVFPSYIAFSGTPGNYKTYGGNPKAPDDKAAIGRMITLLEDKLIDDVHVTNFARTEELPKEPAFAGASAFIDAGAFLDAAEVEIFADDWGEKIDKASARVDAKQGILVKRNREDKSVSLKDSPVAPDDRVTVYPQAHILGTDITQGELAIGVVSINKWTTWTKFEQAVGRMRKIEKGQSVRIIVSADDCVIIRSKLGLPARHKLDKVNIKRFLILNESENQIQAAEVALNHKLQAVIDGHLRKWLNEQDLATLNDDIGSLVKKVFYPVIDHSPYSLFGQDVVVEDAEVAYGNKINRMLENLSPSLKKIFGTAETARLLESFKAQMQKILVTELSNIPAKITVGAQLDLEQELTQEVEMEQEAEMETEQEQEAEQEIEHGLGLAKELQIRRVWPEAPSLRKWEYWKANVRLKSLSEDLKASRVSHQIADLFGPEIFVSDNFQPHTIFAGQPKPVQLVIIARKGSEFSCAFVEPGEAANFKKRLRIDKKEDADVWLGDLSGFMAAGDTSAFDLREASFRKVWAQALLYSGRTTFTSSEKTLIKEYLNVWLDSKSRSTNVEIKGLSPLRIEYLRNIEAFLQKRLATKEDRLARYASSDLAAIIRDLRA